jgi:hypothetical protein
MKSHTVPQRLLQQFAYRDTHTKSLRLWRYEKGRKPYGKASPKSATAFDSHFADPQDTSLEIEIEKRLAVEIEDPVNQFISHFFDSSFVLTDVQREQMTRYVTLLFSRSRASRVAVRHREDMKVHALKKFLANEQQLATVAAQWNLDAYFNRVRLGGLITTDDVAGVARKLSAHYDTASSEQESYVQGIVHFMGYLDDVMFRGEWRLLSTTSDDPFILSDAPVVTWDRRESAGISHGVGFWEPNVEVFLPVSPLTCLHILPKVQRTRAVVEPHVREVNTAQAAFAHHACLANQNKSEIDDLVQHYISTARLGENAFTLWNRNYDNLIYDALMGMGRVTPSK